MPQPKPSSAEVSMPTFSTLEAWTRSQVQELMQSVLEEEVTHALGRARYERQALLDAPSGYRNGHGKPRQLSFTSGTIEVKRPRVRGLEERFESAILPLFARRTQEVRRSKGNSGARTGVSRIDGVVDGRPSRSSRPRPDGAGAVGGRRLPGNLDGCGGNLAANDRTAMLESPHPERAEQTPEKRAGRSAGPALKHGPPTDWHGPTVPPVRPPFPARSPAPLAPRATPRTAHPS